MPQFRCKYKKTPLCMCQTNHRQCLMDTTLRNKLSFTAFLKKQVPISSGKKKSFHSFNAHKTPKLSFWLQNFVAEFAVSHRISVFLLQNMHANFTCRSFYLFLRSMRGVKKSTFIGGKIVKRRVLCPSPITMETTQNIQPCDQGEN